MYRHRGVGPIPTLKKISARWGHIPMPCVVRPSPGVSPKRSILSPTWRGWDFRALGLFQAITTPSSRLSLCNLCRILAAHIAQGIDKTVPSWAYANPVPALASLDVMHSPFICCISPSFWAFWSSSTRCDNARAAARYGPVASPQYERHPRDVPRAKGSLLMHQRDEGALTIRDFSREQHIGSSRLTSNTVDEIVESSPVWAERTARPWDSDDGSSIDQRYREDRFY